MMVFRPRRAESERKKKHNMHLVNNHRQAGYVRNFDFDIFFFYPTCHLRVGHWGGDRRSMAEVQQTVSQENKEKLIKKKR